MQDNGYRIIKLKNGDTIITKIIEIRKKTIIIERPMQYKNIVLMDQSNGNTSEMVVFKTWIDYGIEKIIEIAADGILAITSPQEKIVVCYEMEKNKEDNPVEKQSDKLNDATDDFLNHVNQQITNTPPDNVNVTFNVPQEMAEEIIDMMAEAKAWENMDDEDFEDEDLFPEVKPRKKAKKKKKADPSSNKPPQKKNKKNPNDFGNDWSDWSPDPKDYI
jgi:ribosomal protein L19